MHHEWYEQLGVDVHAVAGAVTDGLRGLGDDDHAKAQSFFAEFIEDFYESAQAERGYPLRIDILIVCDLAHLDPVPIGATQSFAFSTPARKRDALLAVINVLGAGEVDPDHDVPEA